MDDPRLLDQPSVENSSTTEGICSSFEQDRDREHLIHGSELLERLDTEDLTRLREFFYEKKTTEKVKQPKGSAPPHFRWCKLTKEEFVFAVESVLETSAYEIAARRLFDHMVESNADGSRDCLWWEQLLDAVVEWTVSQARPRPSNIIKQPFCQLFTLPHCRREMIVRVVPVETQTSFCYVVVSKYARVGLYDWSLGLLEQYQAKLGSQSEEKRRQNNTWVTDACYLADAAMLLIAVSDRSLHLYSATGLVHVPTYHISGLPNTPTCLNYTIGATTEDPSLLLVGDDHGSIATLTFLQPQYALFKRTSTDRMDTYFWKELESQRDWVTIQTEYGVHKNEVTKVEYFSDNNTVISCSNDPETTVIIRHMVGRRKPYIFKMRRGVRCFHLDRSLKLLVTGGQDGILRLWNPVITYRPTVTLFGHKSCIVDVRALKHLRVILSMSKDAVLKVWDIEEQSCLQSLSTLFPVFGLLSRTPHFGVQVFYPGPVCHDPPTTSVRDKPTLQTKLQTTHPASLLSTSSTTRQDRASVYRNEGEWNRMEILAVCCDYIMILQLSQRELSEGEGRVGEALPPPLREQEPAVPSPWLTVDSVQMSTLNVDHPSQ
ncbi:WD repeat-containing protein on Y chromosome-like [Macrosteles quadrilineatus]|uniref:WD repeat-containing protein on Y chromosome-like n=1 Tax=Macrosteles quadrilineatus TaxID=74068 RepID=UPI0023E27FBF|nr:WD repeat-containing protein on Y chromosome-like [Macrosteles quadrilineatus]